MSSLQRAPRQNTFDEYASDYDATVQAAIGASGESVAYFADLKARLAREEALPGGGTQRVLDFGCGIGNTTRALARAFPGAALVGCDASADSVAVARARSEPRLEFTTTSDRRLPFGDASFDLAVAACVFHHIDAPERRHWVSEIARVLKPGGRFVMFEHNPLNPLTRDVVRRVPFDRGVALLRRAGAARLLREAGLRPRSGRYYFFFPRFLAALRALEPWLGRVPFGAQYYVVGERS